LHLSCYVAIEFWWCTLLLESNFSVHGLSYRSGDLRYPGLSCTLVALNRFQD
jgi:hypothetical protein